MDSTEGMKLMVTFSSSFSGWRPGQYKHEDLNPLCPDKLILPRSFQATSCFGELNSDHVTVFAVDDDIVVVNFGYDPEDTLASWDQTHGNWGFPARRANWGDWDCWAGKYAVTATLDSQNTIRWSLTMYPDNSLWPKWNEAFAQHGPELLRLLTPMRELEICMPEPHPAPPAKVYTFKSQE